MSAWQTNNGNVAVVTGVRTAFTKAGTSLRQADLTELARVVMQEALARAGWPGRSLDEVVLGNVSMPADAANPARVAAMAAGLPMHVPALTVQRNCASGMEAIADGASRIYHGQARSVLVAGAESMSSVPLLFPSETLRPVGRLFKAKTLGQRLAAAATFRPRHFRPIHGLELGLTDPICGMVMGQTADLVGHEFGISRVQQDEYALRSHQRAARAMEAGDFDDQLTPVYAGKRFEPVTQDNGPRASQTMAALAKLRPLFDRRDGTVTVGNACQITDGAACLLIADGKLARAQGWQVLGHVRGYATAALDPARMGLGPVYAIHQLLEKTGLALDDIDLFEINEAFASQVLGCVRAMASDRFCQDKLGRGSAIGQLDIERLNVSGGAIAMGHPVGATGARIVLNLLMQMRRRDAKFGIASLCVGGGQGVAMLLERM